WQTSGVKWQMRGATSEGAKGRRRRYHLPEVVRSERSSGCERSLADGGSLTALQNSFSVAYRPFACRNDFSGFCYEVIFLRVIGASRSAGVVTFLCQRHNGAFCKVLMVPRAHTLIGNHAISSSSRSGGSAIGLSATGRLGGGIAAGDVE